MSEVKQRSDITVLNPVNYENKLREQIDVYISKIKYNKDENINSTNGYSEGNVTHSFFY